ncbi:MAG: LTA synthase family protein [Limisphaerales bacterium]
MAVWSRILVLFLALASIKTAILAGLGKHLGEIHWRVGAPRTTWCDPAVAFYVFVCLGVLSLLGLARRCRSVGVKAVRAANGIVLGFGLLFIFLTFHTGERNYLYPIVTGVLKWTSLGPYLSLDLCFRPPFLAGWLLAYALIYYVLARTGRESWALHVTALCAGGYALFCLRELRAYCNELLLADCLGIVSLLIARFPGKKLQPAWLAAPAVWSLGFAWGLFYVSSPQESVSLHFFLMLLWASVILFSGATLLTQRRGFLGPWSSQVFFYFVAFLLLTNHHYPMAENYNNALCLGLEFPRYFAGELLVAGLLAVCAALYSRLCPRARLWWLDLLSLVFIAAALVDFRLSQIMGVRLGWDVISFGDSPKMMWRMARPYLPGALVAFGLAVLVYALTVRGIQLWYRRLRAVPQALTPCSPTMNLCVLRASAVKRGLVQPQRREERRGPNRGLWEGASASAPGRGVWYAMASFVLLGALGLVVANPDKAENQAGVRLVQTSSAWKRVANRTVSREEFLHSANTLGLGDFEAAGRTYPASACRDLNVVLIFLESSYNKHLSLFGSREATQPLLSKYKDRMEVFPNFFSSFAGSIQARFATFTGLYPVRDFNAFTVQRVNVKSLFEVFHDNGYTSSLFYSSFLDYTGFRDFLRGRGIDELYDADTMPGKRKTEPVSWGLREEETLGAILSQFKKYAARDQRFFLTYVPAAPHYPYDGVADRFRKFKPDQPGDYTPLYLNELLYMDWVMASIVDQLKESGLLDKTLVVITNDHGERTGVDGEAIGHGWCLTPELANTPLIIMDPQNPGYRVNYRIGSQIDLLPTVLDLLKISLPLRQLYEGRSLYAPPEEEDNRLVYLNTYEQYGVIARDHFVSGDRKADEDGASSSPRTIYAISNEGSKTLFSAEPAAKARPLLIRPFDEFQENLLRNYSFYCESVCQTRQMASLRPGR